MDRSRDLAEVDEYASVTAEAKDLDEDGRRCAADAIRTALRRVYRAVAVDIDGTLTPANDAALDPEVAGALKSVLRRGVPVILVTGRGDQAAAEAMDALQSPRRDESPGRLHCLFRNGASVLEPVLGATSDRRYQEQSIGAPLEAAVWDAVSALRDQPDVVRPERPTAAGCQVHAVRLEFRDEGARDSAYAELCPHLLTSQCVVTTAHYQDTHTINVTLITKNEALTRLAAALGLEPDEVMRVGDQGQAGGNDADLLDAVSGFSVDRVSNAPDRCHPVVVAGGRIATGANATVILLEGVVLSPPIKRIDTTVDAAVIRRFGVVERRARAGAESVLEAITSTVARSLAALVDDGGGLSGPSRSRLADIFDPLSGAVRLRDFEVDELQDELGQGHPAGMLFGLTGVFEVPPASALLMASDSGILLRGAHYYMGLISERSSTRVREFFDATSTVAAQGIDAVNALAGEAPGLTRFKLVLGIADHMRNALLQTVYLAWMLESQTQSYLLLPSAVELALEHVASHVKLLLGNNERWHSCLTHYAEGLGAIHDALGGFTRSDLAAMNELALGKTLIREREADDFLVNVAAVRLALEGHRARMALRRGAQVTCFGLPYGGIELPLLAKVLGQQLDLEIVPGYLHASTYEDRELGNSLRSKKTRSVDELSGPFRRWPDAGQVGETVLIADDNTTTAVTLQLAIDLLAINGVDADGAIMVQYPSLNRREHMRLPGHGCIDPDALLGFIRGLIQPTPYTRLLQPRSGEDRYRDPLGVFNKSKERIERLLKKAGLMAREPLEVQGTTNEHPDTGAG